MTRENTQAVIVAADTIFVGQRSQIVQRSAMNRLPSIYPFREDALAGGLMSYGPIQTDIYRRGAIYVDKILKGAKPSELPIEQPTQFELVINRNAATALGIKIPQELLLRANEVIE